MPRLKAMLDGRPAASGDAAAPESSSDNGGDESTTNGAAWGRDPCSAITKDGAAVDEAPRRCLRTTEDGAAVDEAPQRCLRMTTASARLTLAATAATSQQHTARQGDETLGANTTRRGKGT